MKKICVSGINKYSEIGNGSAVKMEVIPLENEKEIRQG